MVLNIFVIVSLLKFSMITVVAADGEDGKKFFCEKFRDLTPSPSFSFDELLHLQGFTYLDKEKQMAMIADDYAYRFYLNNIPENDEQLRITPENIGMPWLQNSSKNILAYAAGFDNDPNDPKDMVHYLFAYKKSWPNPYHVLIIITDKLIRCIDTADQTGLFSFKGPKIKLLTALDQDDYQQMYVISDVPDNKEGLIIYRFEVGLGDSPTFVCKTNTINSTRDLEIETYFYLQRTNDSKTVGLVHPVKGDVTQAKLYPLAERVMPGYIYAKSLYLFDVDLGCVYIIPEWTDFDLRKEYIRQNHYLLRRINVPFEKFFVCEEVSMEKLFSLFDSNRCETTIFSVIKHKKSPAQDENGQSRTIISGSRSNLFENGKLIGISAFFLIIICIFYLGFVRIRRRKNKNKNKSGGKSGRKTSAFPKSKRPNKGTFSSNTNTASRSGSSSL